MKLSSIKHILVTVFAVASISTLSATEVRHRFATYNIRYVAEKNGDTGDRLWMNRRSSVFRIFRDYDFDICGFAIS